MWVIIFKCFAEYGVAEFFKVAALKQRIFKNWQDASRQSKQPTSWFVANYDFLLLRMD